MWSGHLEIWLRLPPGGSWRPSQAFVNLWALIYATAVGTGRWTLGCFCNTSIKWKLGRETDGKSMGWKTREINFSHCFAELNTSSKNPYLWITWCVFDSCMFWWVIVFPFCMEYFLLQVKKTIIILKKKKKPDLSTCYRPDRFPHTSLILPQPMVRAAVGSRHLYCHLVRKRDWGSGSVCLTVKKSPAWWEGARMGREDVSVVLPAACCLTCFSFWKQIVIWSRWLV